MVLTHLDSRPGEVLVRLPDGSQRWVKVGDMIALAESDHAKPETAIEKAIIGGGKTPKKR